MNNQSDNGSYSLIELTSKEKVCSTTTATTNYALVNDDNSLIAMRDSSITNTEYFEPSNTTNNIATNTTKKEEKSYLCFSTQDQEEVKRPPIDPWSRSYIGILISYFSVGILYGGSTSILYPILIVQQGVSSSLYTACVSVVTIFWSYKIFFGMLSDCAPIFGYKRKPYIILGWLLCAFTLILVTYMEKGGSGDSITSWKHLVLMFTLANLGYVMADVAADAYMVFIAHCESEGKKGNMQTLIYSCNYFGQMVVSLLVLFAFSGPEVNCAGYEKDANAVCSNDETVMSRNEFSEDYPDDWCHMQCSNATFNFGLSVPEYAGIIASINLLCIPFYFMLHEEKTKRASLSHFISSFWTQLQRRAAWQLILYVLISNITFGVINAAKPSTNYVWLNLNSAQNQIMIILEKCMFVVGLTLIRKYALQLSWRVLVIFGSILVTTFNLLYFLIVYDIYRSSWFYIFTDVSSAFTSTLNFMSTGYCMVEIAEPGMLCCLVYIVLYYILIIFISHATTTNVVYDITGYEAVTYALITTASNAVVPLSSVISFQFLAFFPDLNTQASIATDTADVRWQFATLHLITILVNISSLLALPMLPRQKKETRELVSKGETSFFWGSFTLVSGIIFLLYSTIVTFMTVAGADTYGCYKVLGGGGCSDDESSIPAYLLVFSVFLYCYGVNFYLSFLPILQRRQTWSCSMFY